MTKFLDYLAFMILAFLILSVLAFITYLFIQRPISFVCVSLIIAPLWAIIRVVSKCE